MITDLGFVKHFPMHCNSYASIAIWEVNRRNQRIPRETEMEIHDSVVTMTRSYTVKTIQYCCLSFIEIVTAAKMI